MIIERQKPIDNLQAVRGIAVLLVIFFHLAVMDHLYGGGKLVHPIFYLGIAGVDIFFVISGFIMVYTTYAKFDDPGYVRTFAIRRITRIVPLYWLLSALVFFFSLFFPNMINKSFGFKVDVVASLFFLPSHILPLVPVGWTLNYEMYFYFVFALFILFVRRKWLGYALAVWCVAALVLGSNPPTAALAESAWWGQTFSPFVFEFSAGALIGLIFLSSVRGFGIIASLIALVWFAVALVALQYYRPGDEHDPMIRVMAYGPPSALLIYGVIMLELQQDFKLPGFLIRFGDASYSIYLTHTLVMHFIGKFFWSRIEGADRLVSCFFGALELAASILVGFVCYQLVELRFIRWGRKRLVGRPTVRLGIDYLTWRIRFRTGTKCYPNRTPP